MKRLIEYIKESKDNKVDKWMKCVEKMYSWYCKNYNSFYDDMHFYSEKNHKECELIDNKKTIADCSGFVAACLCLAGYTGSPRLFNVRLGSFNHYKNANDDDLDKSDTGQKEKIKYMADIPDFECIKLDDSNKEKLKGVKRGDILVKGSHVTIVADDNVSELYDWGFEVKDKHINNKPVPFYVPADKTETYPYRSLWRLK